MVNFSLVANLIQWKIGGVEKSHPNLWHNIIVLTKIIEGSLFPVIFPKFPFSLTPLPTHSESSHPLK